MTYLERIISNATDRPAHTAVTWPGGRLSYAGLIARAEMVAARLCGRGIRRGDPVGLRVPRGPELLTGMLGVTAAGGMAVPIAVSEVPERARAIIADSGLSIMVRSVTEPAVPNETERLDLAPDGAPVGSADGAVRRPHNPEPLSGADGAYLLYTSGTSGRPKGVVVEHSSLDSYLDWCARTFVDPALPMPVTASPAFDSVFKQALAPLLSGAATWMIGEKFAENPAALARLAADPARPMTLNCVPSLWRAVLADWPAPEGAPAGLRRLLLGGEPLDDNLLTRTRRILPGVEIWNLYGPTEATANASAGPVEQVHVTLGAALPGSALHVLRPDGTAAAAGDNGELYISGTGVARGYHGMPAHTAERFLPDPYASVPGARMFRTGDLVLIHDTGRLEFRGRADRMVKRSGVRIELGEIEHALRRIPGVTDAVVLAAPRAGGGPRLTAFAESVDMPGSEMRRALADVLPRAAVPDVVHVVAALPRTPGGKADLARLREADVLLDLDTGPSGPEQATGEPEDRSGDDTIAQTVATIWAEVLEHDTVPHDADFFELGGHSLAMIRIIGRVAERLGVEVGVDVLYDAPTVAEFSALVRRETIVAVRG